MRALFLESAGVLAIVAAVVHGVLGETKVFARTRVEPPRMRSLLRAIWQCGAVAWGAGGMLLLAAPRFPADPRHWIVLTCVAIYGAAVVGNAWVFRGRHAGWMLLGTVVALALAGL